MTLFIIFYAVMTLLSIVDGITGYVTLHEYREVMDSMVKSPLGRLAIIVATSLFWPLSTVFSIIENIGNLKR